MAWNWREFRVADTALHIAMPCQPSTDARTLPLAGHTVRWTVLLCAEEQQTFALGWGRLGEASAVGPALGELVRGAASNLQATVLTQQPATVPGMTPQAAALRTVLKGRSPDGQPTWAEVWVFAHGLQVYQATWMSAQPAGDQAQHFVQALKLRQ